MTSTEVLNSFKAPDSSWRENGQWREAMLGRRWDHFTPNPDGQPGERCDLMVAVSRRPRPDGKEQVVFTVLNANGQKMDEEQARGTLGVFAGGTDGWQEVPASFSHCRSFGLVLSGRLNATLLAGASNQQQQQQRSGNS